MNPMLTSTRVSIKESIAKRKKVRAEQPAAPDTTKPAAKRPKRRRPFGDDGSASY